MRVVIIGLIAICFLIFSCTIQAPSEYVIEEIDLVPEGIAYSEKMDAFYLTSITKSKIVKVDRRTGAESDFIDENEYGYAPGVGVLIDKDQLRVHALGGYWTKDSLSALFTFDLESGELERKYECPEEGEHFLNDLIQDRAGNIYLTDTKDSSIYILRKNGSDLELFYKSSEIKYPNGIAISDDNSKLFIASYRNGVRILDLATKEILNSKDSLRVSQGIDGLEFYKGHLYAIQNGAITNTDNLRKLVLNSSQDSIIRVEVIDSHTPKLNSPLTFCIEQGNAVVIANSNLQYLDQESLTFPELDSVVNTRLIVYPLDSSE